MKMLMRTVKKTKTVATLFILLSLACFLTSLRSHFTADTQNSDAVSYTDDHQSYQVIYGLDEQIQMHVLYYFMDFINDCVSKVNLSEKTNWCMWSFRLTMS